MNYNGKDKHDCFVTVPNKEVRASLLEEVKYAVMQEKDLQFLLPIQHSVREMNFETVEKVLMSYPFYDVSECQFDVVLRFINQLINC